MRPKEKAPRIFEIEDPRILPSARDDLCWLTAATTTASYTPTQQQQPGGGFRWSNLFPLCTCGKQGDKCWGDSEPTCYLCGVVDKRVCTKLQDKQPCYKGGHVKAHIVVVHHLESRSPDRVFE